MKLFMILLCKGTCVPVATPFKRQGGSALAMHPHTSNPAGASHQLNQFLVDSKPKDFECIYLMFFCN